MDIRTWVNDHPKGQRNRAIEQLAAEAGVTPGAVRHWVSGLRKPRLCHLTAIEKATGIPMADLLKQALEDSRAA